MRNSFKSVLAIGAAAATLAVAGVAGATSTANGVFFVHGTGDYADAVSPTLNPTSGTAVKNYWMQFSLDKMRTSPVDGSKWNYGVAGYAGAAQNAQTTYATVGAQMFNFYHSYGPLLNMVVVTHSNGSNPVRYLLAHPTAMIADNGGSTCAAKLFGGTCAGTTYPGIVKRVVMIAGDNSGTPLADLVTSSGSFANIGNELVKFFGGGSYNVPAVYQQIQANMTTYNGNGTFATNAAPGVAPSYYVDGTAVYATIGSSDAACGYDENDPDATGSCGTCKWYDAPCWISNGVCNAKKAAARAVDVAGGYATTAALYAAAKYGWGSFSASTDGFIGVNSATSFGSYGWSDARFNHNQSRRSCHGGGTQLASLIHGAMGNTFDTIPADYTTPLGVQACNTTTSGWQSASPYAGNFLWSGCTQAMSTDGATDFDCQSTLGGDNGNVLPASEHAGTSSSYFVNSYYSGGTGCSDTWRGDGECDLCLLAKYGADSAPGTSGADDCVDKGTGTTNHCADLAYYDQTSAWGYYSYTANH